MTEPLIRPLTVDDTSQLLEVTKEAFGRLHIGPDAELKPHTEQEVIDYSAWFRHTITGDPGGAWGAVDPEDDARLVGAVIAFRRGGLWFLSLLCARPSFQAAGLGARMITASEAILDGATAGGVCASKDPRAVRRYWRSGLQMEPVYEATGRLDPSTLPPVEGVRIGDVEADAGLIDEVDLLQRGHPRRPDIAGVMKIGYELRVVDEPGARGYVVCRNGRVWGLAATDDATARRLLLAGLSGAGPDEDALVQNLGPRSRWALDVAFEAGLRVEPDGGMGFRGDVGPMTSYLVNGAFG